MKNRKDFFDRLATSLNLDPGDPKTWYSITRDQVLRAKVSIKNISYWVHIDYFIKGGRGVLWYYNYSYVTAIASIYPNIGLDSAKFSTPPSTYQDQAFFTHTH
jgi:hypothetical protein